MFTNPFSPTLYLAKWNNISPTWIFLKIFAYPFQKAIAFDQPIIWSAVWIHLPKNPVATPPKTNMEPKNGGLVQMIVLFNWVIFRFHVNFQAGIASCLQILQTLLSFKNHLTENRLVS